MAYDNTNRGTIAKNTRKTEDKHPDIAGTINVDGVDYWLNGWAKKNSNDGSSFYSLTVKPKQDRAAPPRGTTKKADDDEIGF
jgi:hypothetical protein